MKYKYNGQWYDLSIKALDGMPIGSIILFAGTDIPTGWMLCDGTSLSEEEYPQLFDKIGYTYGGSGTSFSLPNFKGRVGVGKDTTKSYCDNLGETGGSVELQAHSHNLTVAYNTGGTQYGATVVGGTSKDYLAGYVNQEGTGNSGNLQPYIVVNYIIKVSNTTPTMASVVDGYSTSAQDAYSCSYANQHFDGVELYSSVSGSTGNITLSQSVSNFNELEIEFERGGYHKTTGRIKNFTGIILDGYWTYLDSGLNKYVYQSYCEMPTISGTTITRANTNYTNVVGDGGGTYTGSFANGISIKRVIGYK